MYTYTRAQLQHALKNQVKRISGKVASLNALSKRFSTGRLVTFIIGMALIYMAASWGHLLLFVSFIALFIIGFGYLVHRHRQIDDTIEKLRIWKHIRNTHLSRMNLDWNQLPETSMQFSRQDHEYAHDLNLIGKHSLLQLIDTSIFAGGRKRLTSWFLKNEPDITTIKKRQKLAAEIADMPHFRDQLQLRARQVKAYESEGDWSMDTLQKWLETPSGHNFTTPLILLGSLAATNIILLGLWLTGMADPYVIFTFVFYLIIYNFNSEKFTGLFDAAYQTEKLLKKFSTILSYLETYNYKKESNLKRFCEKYHKPEQRPSVYLKKIVRISAAASSQSSEIVWLLLNAVVPWDMYFAARMERFKKELSPHLDEWLNRFYDLEALCSIANFKWLNPHYTFTLPKPIQSQEPAFQATDLGHPLIPENQKVTNSVTIDSLGEILLITGSNMAGKSTFLRTVGINLAICFAGGPVNASTFRTIPFRIFSSINVKDSLDRGLSHFYAEVKRLRKLMDALQAPDTSPLFFFVDEIYKGTNNRERLAGSSAFLKKVSGSAGIGMISTHDLELAQLEEEIQSLTNYHFEETIEGNKMRFEYKLKPGPCPTTNALKIMEMEGLPTE